MLSEHIIEISKECAYCDKAPVKLVSVRIGWTFRYEVFVCKEHVELAIGKAYEKRAAR